MMFAASASAYTAGEMSVQLQQFIARGKTRCSVTLGVTGVVTLLLR